MLHLKSRLPQTWNHMKKITGLLLIAVMTTSCGNTVAQEQDASVRSFLEGDITINAQIDSVGDYSGIEILVANREGNVVDTLGFAVTDADGHFEMDVNADQGGVFPIMIIRRGNLLNVSEYVVADADTATFRAELPLGNRKPLIRSRENSAWLAFKNTEAQHQQMLMDIINAGKNNVDEVGNTIELTSTLLWSLKESFPNTIGSNLAAAKSIVMLDGWNDSLLVARALELDPTITGFSDVASVARRATARMQGQEAAIQFVESLMDKVDTDDKRAALRVDIIQAHLDSLQAAQVIARSNALAADFPDSRWAAWARRSIYEAENLMPGMKAPAFTVVDTTSGVPTFTLEEMQGTHFVLEFWSPRDPQYAQQLPQIEAILAETEGHPFTWVFVGLEHDPELYDAFFEARDTYGKHVRTYGNQIDEMIRVYNLGGLPTRFLIDASGTLKGRYSGNLLLALERDVLKLLAESEGRAN
jgi:peroxiredoxin